jgi:3-methyl-2-oxobutanoate hydroxymethyltransferase
MILAKKGQEKIKMITAYDTPSAQIADKAGADIILVGDSLATVILGYETTLSATMDTMIHHATAVARARPHSLIVGDMPWLSFHVSEKETIRNAGRFIREAGAQAVKLEGGRKRINMIKALLDAEIPVMGHLGLTPQSFYTMGGYRVQGKNTKVALELIEDARSLTKAGVFALILEGIPDKLAQIITKSINIPTIGIGAGPRCDGQVLVFHDALGLNFGHVPKFVRQYANLSEVAVKALSKFFADTKSGKFPADSESYHLDEKTLQEIRSTLKKTK